MQISPGYLYFISNDFFRLVNDPNLKINYESTSRPHYLAIAEEKTSLFWVVPISSKVAKFQSIIAKKEAAHRPTNAIIIVKFQGMERALLFQDMFPVIQSYIDQSYTRGGQPVFISGSATREMLFKNAKIIIAQLRHGVRFTPTQPDVGKIERIMLEELRQRQPEKVAEQTSPATLADRLADAKQRATEQAPDRQSKKPNLER